MLSVLACHDHAIVSSGGSQKVLLHQAIDTFHQSLAKKPDAAFCTEKLAKALGDALNETDFFMTSVGRRRRSTTTTTSSSSAAATRRSRRNGWLSIVNQFVDISWIGGDWAKDGLSLSVESASDVDMT
jgi:hypothetical protein